MRKPYLYLIVVWSIICASGLAIFLFQIFGPSIDIAGDSSDTALSPLVAVGFWIFLWAVPVLIITLMSRRQEG